MRFPTLPFDLKRSRFRCNFCCDKCLDLIRTVSKTYPIDISPVKVTGDSLLIHEFAYSLFIGLCSVTSNMTGYSRSYHLIKLIHCGAPQRDELNDKMVL